jgi:hypothetical protein
MCGAGSQRLIHAQEHRHLHQRTRAQPIMLASNVHVAVFSAVLLTLRRGYYLRGEPAGPFAEPVQAKYFIQDYCNSMRRLQ